MELLRLLKSLQVRAPHPLYPLHPLIILGKKLMERKVHQDPIKKLAFDEKFAFLGTASKDGVNVLDPRTLKRFRFFKTNFPMNAVAFSPSIYHPTDKRFHMLMGGGIIAREAARTKFGGYQIHLQNLMY